MSSQTSIPNQDLMGMFEDSHAAHTVLAQGAVVRNLPRDKTFMVAWFPKTFARHAIRRTLFVLHSEKENAYQAVLNHLPMARRYNYALVSLQWQRIGQEPLTAEAIHRILYYNTHDLSEDYNVDLSRMALDTSGDSARMSYEIAYWDANDHSGGGLPSPNLFKLIIAQSGGVPPAELLSKEHATPLIQKFVQGKLGPDAFRGRRFYLYCGEKGVNSEKNVCERMRNARKLIEANGGKVVRFIEEPAGESRGLYTIPKHFQAVVETFLAATR